MEGHARRRRFWGVKCWWCCLIARLWCVGFEADARQALQIDNQFCCSYWRAFTTLGIDYSCRIFVLIVNFGMSPELFGILFSMVKTPWNWENRNCIPIEWKKISWTENQQYQLRICVPICKGSICRTCARKPELYNTLHSWIPNIPKFSHHNSETPLVCPTINIHCFQLTCSHWTIALFPITYSSIATYSLLAKWTAPYHAQAYSHTNILTAPSILAHGHPATIHCLMWLRFPLAVG